MTTNKPKIVAWLRNERGEYARGPATFDPMCVFGSREPQGLEASYSPVVMISEYEALQAECERLRALLSQSAPIVHAHAGASHLLEGFRPKRNQWDDLAETIETALQKERKP